MDQTTEKIKEQLIANIKSSFPPEKANVLQRQILAMSDEQLERFMESQSNESSCIFCSIASGSTESYKIDENPFAMAVLEINPVSPGHTIVIPKEHLPTEELSKNIHEFAEKVARKLKEKLNPKDVEIASVTFKGHGVINLIPVYKDESISSERHRATKEELEEVLKKINNPEEPKKEKEPAKIKKARVKRINSKKNWLPKRIP